MQKSTKYFIGILVVAVILIVAGSMTRNVQKVWADTDIKCLLNGHENLSQHIHPMLTITVDGIAEVLPANIGIVDTCMAELHTHETDGKIHIESVVMRTFALGDFYTVWDKTIERDGYDVVVKSEGVIVESPEELELEDLQKIEVVYTTKE